ncbi:MAG: hypothetical protein IKM79_01195, partial [Bacteroidales bacterium]|nr:hypothetical protein [Bacteroidales bacterium]
MKKKQTIKYIVFDTLSAMLAWAALFLFRKLHIEQAGASDVNLVFQDTNFWLGLVIVPAAWLALYTMQGTYRNVLRKARVKELIDTLVASVLGVIVIFFSLLIDDEITTYHHYYSSFLFLLAVHFALTYTLRLLVTSQTARKVHSRQIGFPTLMVGAGPKAYQTYLDLENQETYSGNQLVGYIETSRRQDIETSGKELPKSALEKVIPRLGTLDDLRSLVDKYQIEEAIIAVEENEQGHISEILHALYCCGDIIIKIQKWIKTRNPKRLLWTITFATFVISANLDNLTTATMMLVIMHSIVQNRRQRMLIGCAIVIAANCGGCFTVIGDPTGLLLWGDGAITATSFSSYMALPAILAWMIPTIFINRALPERLDTQWSPMPYRGDDTNLSPWQRVVMLFVGIGGLWFIPTFHNITKLSPFLGALCVLSVLWVVNEAFNRKLMNADQMSQRFIPRALQYGSLQQILFVMGIMLGMGVVTETGVFPDVAQWMDETIHNVWILGI